MNPKTAIPVAERGTRFDIAGFGVNRPLTLAPASSVWRSNLGVALLFLEPSRRRDAVLFYRFCRAVDDVADDRNRAAGDRLSELERWSVAVQNGLPADLEEVVRRHRIPRDWLQSLVRGCRRDVEGLEFETWSELEGYCHDVASSVGMVCARIFGCESDATIKASARLGLGLQLVNIARDFRGDAEAGRCYVPSEFLRLHGLSRAAIMGGLAGPPLYDWTDRARRVLSRMEFAPEDVGRMLPARLMREVYLAILQKIEARRGNARLSIFEKLSCAVRVFRESPNRQ